MSGKIFGPRKRRTRQHVIADQGVHHVLGHILDAGYTAEEYLRDYGYDLQMTTYDEDGFVEPGRIYFQVKASESLKRRGSYFVFDLDIRDYNLWLIEKIMVVLVLYDATRRRAYWLDVHEYFRENVEEPKMRAKWVRVRIPLRQRLTEASIRMLRLRKPNVIVH
jgi:hypothetical protein